MQLFALLALVTSGLAVSLSSKHRQRTPSTEAIVSSLAQSNHFGSPSPGTIGWYFGDNPGAADDIPWLKDPDLCAVLAQNSDCIQCPGPKPTPTSAYPKPSGTPTQTPPPPPPPPGNYYPVFSNLTGAVQAGDYMTYGLVDTIPDCEAMCDSVAGCTFINTYHDVNGKDGSPLLTCALFTQHHTAADADNLGGQSQPNGSTDFITDSDGFDRN